MVHFLRGCRPRRLPTRRLRTCETSPSETSPGPLSAPALTPTWLEISSARPSLRGECLRAETAFRVSHPNFLPPSSGVTLSNITLAGYKTWSCANIAEVRVEPPGSVSPDPGLYGCLGDESVVAPAYHASNFQ